MDVSYHQHSRMIRHLGYFTMLPKDMMLVYTCLPKYLIDLPSVWDFNQSPREPSYPALECQEIGNLSLGQPTATEASRLRGGGPMERQRRQGSAWHCTWLLEALKKSHLKNNVTLENKASPLANSMAYSQFAGCPEVRVGPQLRLGPWGPVRSTVLNQKVTGSVRQKVQSSFIVTFPFLKSCPSSPKES